MLVLGIDTSTASTSVGLVDDRGSRGSADHLDSRHHAEILPRLVREVITAAEVTVQDIGAVACGVGPGPFTGLRVGITFARSLAQGLGVDVVGVCSLDALAAEAAVDGAVTTFIKVRRAEFAWAAYDASGARVAGPLVGREGDLPTDGVRVGDSDGFDALLRPTGLAVASIAHRRLAAGEALPEEISWPEDRAEGSGESAAAALARYRAAGHELLPPLPLYLRRPDAVPMAER